MRPSWCISVHPFLIYNTIFPNYGDLPMTQDISKQINEKLDKIHTVKNRTFNKLNKLLREYYKSLDSNYLQRTYVLDSQTDIIFNRWPNWLMKRDISAYKKLESLGLEKCID